jgi:hypothetical protein
MLTEYSQNPPDQLGTMVYAMVYTIVLTLLKQSRIAPLPLLLRLVQFVSLLQLQLKLFILVDPSPGPVFRSCLLLRTRSPPKRGKGREREKRTS